MESRGKGSYTDEYSVIGSREDVGFLDLGNDLSLCDYGAEDDEPVIISTPFPLVNDRPQSAFIDKVSTSQITIRNKTNVAVDIWAIRIYYSSPKDSFKLSIMEPPSTFSDESYVRAYREGDSLEDRVLSPKQTLRLWLSCKPKELGMHQALVHFDTTECRIERAAFLLAEDNVAQSLSSSRPYSRNPRRKNFSINDFVPMVHPSRSKPAPASKKAPLPEYPIPKRIRELVADKKIPWPLDEGLTVENYSAYFSSLLILEELHLEEEMGFHGLDCVCMKEKGPDLLSLHVPGLSDRKPSLGQGDTVFVKHGTDRVPYQGIIFRIKNEELLLKFAKDVHRRHIDSNLYNICFSYNRVNMRRLYQAIEAAETLENGFLFPSTSNARKSSPFPPLTSGLNEEQKLSIQKILSLEGAPPYVIFGPPGTGKTATMAEAVLQLYKTRNRCRILICAASNSAADHILEKLVANDAEEVNNGEIFRLNATSRPFEDLLPDHRRFCYYFESIFKCPPRQALMQYRIIISTYASCASLRAEGLERGHFSHIFLDEAGQASEPECMIPMANFCQKETVVVLAGDPKQLGPVVHSKDAATLGLGKSFLERLFEMELYRNENNDFITKLVRNYRCHPAILDLPSKLFYSGDLLACKENSSALSASDDLLPNSEFPILFDGVMGCDEREGNNPSWFNRIEASKVMELIRRLIEEFDLSESDIGVITPYQQQVVKIRKVLENRDINGVKVGSVEQFQGQEKEVIIVSTVRSMMRHEKLDRMHSLGFLSDWRRFNVAITRARSLLVIIGNPHVVCKDPSWDKLLKYCLENNSYQGCPLPEWQKHSNEEEVSEAEGASAKE
ncbi:hypothetical protein MLD38_023694 [Melastoma candidum]|uniref:Uncharacterized protein n=1 Tax=Melastoma candidum TaxID=119954 RepID=A0ACB9NTD0_9MYRT|nr:hypothetical protein MLD38_023694 [Melastoma candidum]